MGAQKCKSLKELNLEDFMCMKHTQWSPLQQVQDENTSNFYISRTKSAVDEKTGSLSPYDRVLAPYEKKIEKNH